MPARRVRVVVLVATLVSTLLGLSSTAQAIAPSEAFDNVWRTTDQAVANGSASYSWFWGPTVNSEGKEPYLNSPGGQRDVRYYDKSRMEINNPNGDPNNIYYVTNGLLTVELVTGKLKTGDGPNDFVQHDPANQLVAGDPIGNPGTPSYAAFAPYVTTDGATNRESDHTGQAVTSFLNGAGQLSGTDSRGVSLAHFDDRTGHNIANVFWDWFNNPNSGFRPDVGVDWVYAAGLPISEPYWIDSTVGRSSKRVLVQLFERRVLTYTESNNDPYRIEWGNIGQHYQHWYEVASAPALCPDSPEGTYVYVADTLNDRVQKFDGDGNFVCQLVGDYDYNTQGPDARPQAVAVDNLNNLYVEALGRIQKFDREGRLTETWDIDINVWDIAIDNEGNLYGTDLPNSQVVKYDPHGNLIDQWGTLGSGDGQFDSLTGIAIDNQDNVYIADRNNNRIQKFDSDGTYLDQWNADGVEADLWGFPSSVAVDLFGNTYATSIRVYKFDASGNFVDVWGDPGDITGSGDIDVADDGTVFAIDLNNVQILHFDSDGNPLGGWGSEGSGQGQFSSPDGVATSTR